MNWKLPGIQAGFRNGRGTRDQIANTFWIIEKAREFQKNIYLCFIDYTKASDSVDHNKMWKTLGEMGIPDHITCLLRNLCVGQEATQNLIWDNWLVQTEKAAQQGCLLSPCLLNLYTEHIMRNASLDDLQAGIKISGKNINNLRYADDTPIGRKWRGTKEPLWRWKRRLKQLAWNSTVKSIRK